MGVTKNERMTGEAVENTHFTKGDLDITYQLTLLKMTWLIKAFFCNFKAMGIRRRF